MQFKAELQSVSLELVLSFTGICTYAEENDCIYIDFFEKVEEIGLNCDTDFQDKGHLNTSGARKIANYLGRFISENYDITDMRMVEGNIWEKNCTR